MGEMIVNHGPQLRNVSAKPKGAATVIDLEDAMERDFPAEKEEEAQV